MPHVLVAELAAVEVAFVMPVMAQISSATYVSIENVSFALIMRLIHALQVNVHLVGTQRVREPVHVQQGMYGQTLILYVSHAMVHVKFVKQV